MLHDQALGCKRKGMQHELLDFEVCTILFVNGGELVGLGHDEGLL